MFRTRQNVPAADIDRYLPLLRVYAKAHYRPKGKQEAGDPFPAAETEHVRFSRAEVTLNETEKDRMPVVPGEVKKDLSLLDSPAMKRYYHSWEKKESVTKTFSSEVMRRVNASYEKMSAFYLPAGIDKRTFNKIKNDYLYKPSRSTAMKCCLGLKLNREEAEELMKLAGFSFSPSDPSDLVVMFCIEKEIWDLASVNYLMASFDIRDLEGVEPGGMM